MRYFYDCEFHEDGETIDLISIGIVAQDGREYYAVATDADWQRIEKNDWLMANVVPQLPDRGSPEWKPRNQIRDEVSEFLKSPDANKWSGGAELWADFGAYDHVCLAQLFGTMMDLPRHVPMHTNEFQQRIRDRGVRGLPVQESGVHDALADARHLKVCFGVVS
ncbi:3'-5' exoribonuclease domain-containing protein [Rhodococcus erythropolis]|uniref:3'-5' exoribonuclease domain-containing protein n=1 Tax=Rhodococcus erythropolis TaxID=1833 RepID=UPI001BEA9228|nr:3'-5' exoribonuclease [Rhodococcus erythropolis]MBT2266438.1 3'-5' exoribonuclease [Rhodococcus erythropolis]